jgi:hypothetical protein
VSIELFRRRADECRHLATAARDANDKAFWIALVERWQALENQRLSNRHEANPGHPSADNLNCWRPIEWRRTS